MRVTRPNGRRSRPALIDLIDDDINSFLFYYFFFVLPFLQKRPRAHETDSPDFPPSRRVGRPLRRVGLIRPYGPGHNHREDGGGERDGSGRSRKPKVRDSRVPKASSERTRSHAVTSYDVRCRSAENSFISPVVVSFPAYDANAWDRHGAPSESRRGSARRDRFLRFTRRRRRRFFRTAVFAGPSKSLSVFFDKTPVVETIQKTHGFKNRDSIFNLFFYIFRFHRSTNGRRTWFRYLPRDTMTSVRHADNDIILYCFNLLRGVALSRKHCRCKNNRRFFFRVRFFPARILYFRLHGNAFVRFQITFFHFAYHAYKHVHNIYSRLFPRIILLHGEND